MVPRFETCDPVRLELFLGNQLSDDLRREIESHLLTCANCQEKLDTLAGGARWWTDVRRYLGSDGADALGRTCATLPPREHPEMTLSFLQPSDDPAALGRLGPYEVHEILGQGGMGIVLKAFDASLNRPVAVKVLAAEFAANASARKRFIREAQAAAAIAHEHVVPVHAVDAEATPPYLVMAFIPGQSLQQRLDRSGPLELREILRIGTQTASGLAAAHAQGLVHRDIKPANIMLENGIERVRITDFGLARAVDDASITMHGGVAGTPQYMAPEQAQGEAVDQRADLFSLGSTLYAMCTGQAPFRGDSAPAVLRQVCDEEPRPVRSLNPDVPLWLTGIIGRLLEKEPAKRFQSAAEVAQLLGQCLAHVQQPDQHPLPKIARELGEQFAPPAPARQRRWLPRSAVVALLIAIAGTCAYLARPNVKTPTTTTSEITNDAPEIEPPAIDDDFINKQAADFMNNEAVGILQRFKALEMSISRDMPGESGEPQTSLNAARARAELIRQNLEAGAPANDPIEAEIESIRRRLLELQQRAEREIK